ncbi:MAG: phospholipase [Syntrophus sp. (in: bacteria)]|nr:phospholipase [Syntrophus sp. (in: bacteria)]
MLKSKRIHQRSPLLRHMCMAILGLIVFSPSLNYAVDMDDHFAQCAGIDNNTKRLDCFDMLSGRKIPVTETIPAVLEKNKIKPVTSVPMEAISEESTKTKPSVMSRQWELDPSSRKDPFVIRLHRPNYILPVTYNASPNPDSILDTDRNAESQNTEAKFQLSFKVKLWEDVMDKDVDLWLAYTQLSFWQAYNTALSSPFRESNYEPELLLNFRTDYNLLGLRGRIINVGINHQSNGRSEILSRSWNRVVANIGFERKDFNLLLKTWYRIPESADKDDNRQILKYTGYGELWGTYYWNKHRFGVMLRNNLRMGDNKGAIQLDWSFPFPFIKNNRFSGYIQYFNGYGESLLDYDKSINRIGIGIMLSDWN